MVTTINRDVILEAHAAFSVVAGVAADMDGLVPGLNVHTTLDARAVEVDLFSSNFEVALNPQWASAISFEDLTTALEGAILDQIF